MKRVTLIVLDSFGVGALADAADFGDVGTSTIRSVSKSEFLNVPNMQKLGLFNIDGVEVAERAANNTAPVEEPQGAYGRMIEVSRGKDTTIGHWEIAGIQTMKALPTYPNGFPKEVLDKFSEITGRGVLCNMPYSGTAVINEYGDEHVKTGDLIVYTSADSVFQIAAHEDVVPVETLYEYCHLTRELLQGEHGVGRVIARPFVGESGDYTRTSRRHDYSLEPTGVTMLDQLKAAGKDVLAVGKIKDIFAGRGVTDFVYTTGNEDGIEKTLNYMDQDFDGLLFVNLVDFDMLYGHRNDIDGYAKALSSFDEKLPDIYSKMGEEDVLMITADHGCDPGYTQSTDHSREHIPFIMYGKNVTPGNFGTRESFSDIAATVLHYLGFEPETKGTSVL